MRVVDKSLSIDRHKIANTNIMPSLTKNTASAQVEVITALTDLFQVKTGLNQAMTGMGDEIKEFKANTEGLTSDGDE